MNKAVSYVLVTLQFSLLIALAWYGSVFGGWFQNILLAAAVALGTWAIVTMRFSVSVLPDVREHQTLITAGPYTYIRHPMYTAVLLAGMAWALNKVSFISWALWFALLVVLVTKLHYEERRLLAKFPAYKAYMQSTKRLLPFLY